MNPVVAIHVLFGALALGAGAAALSLRKGSSLHARAGTIFFGAMLMMTGTGALVAAFLPERGTAVIGIFTAYLVATSWATARRRDGKARGFEFGGLAVALVCATLMLTFALQAAASPTGRVDSLPAGAHYPFAIVAAIAAALDLNFVLRGTLTPRQRIARHLWRMCAALIIASASFFLGQQDEFPESWRGAFIWFMPPLATLALMVFWLVRVRLAKGMGLRTAPRANPMPASASA